MVKNKSNFKISLLKLGLLILIISLPNCKKERIDTEVVMDDNFQPITTPFDLSSIAYNQNAINCFYRNNFVNLLISSPDLKAIEWSWFDGNSFIVIGDTEEMTVSMNGAYRVLAKYNEKDSIINFELTYCKTSIEFPQVFTPNSSQFSEWRPIGTGVLRWNLEIFNNENRLVYSSNSFLNTNWDGNYRGNSSPSGTYKYYIKGIYRTGEVFEKTGDFELVR